MPEFDTCYEAVRTRHDELERIQVPSAAMEELVLGAGVPAEKVFRIPIGIDLERFMLRTPDERQPAPSWGCRATPSSPGRSKGGVGWDDGLERSRRGAGLLLAAVERLRQRVPTSGSCSGPARGYVKQGLERAFRSGTCCCTDRTMSQRRTGRSTSAS